MWRGVPRFIMSRKGPPPLWPLSYRTDPLAIMLAVQLGNCPARCPLLGPRSTKLGPQQSFRLGKTLYALNLAGPDLRRYPLKRFARHLVPRSTPGQAGRELLSGPRLPKIKLPTRERSLART